MTARMPNSGGSGAGFGWARNGQRGLFPPCPPIHPRGSSATAALPGPSAHAVAVQRTVREADIVRHAPGVDEATLVAVHAARPLDCWMCRTFRAARLRPSQKTPLLPATTRAGAAKVDGAVEDLGRTVRGNPATSRRSGQCGRSGATAAPPPARQNSRARPAPSIRPREGRDPGQAPQNFGKSWIPEASAFAAMRGFGFRSLVGCLRG